ncbi:GAF and ANTAR domain-containing protein [Actinoplanes derwentensis]|uniref:ANTAR domain-containing protein n=1 Tax=Actinoplanes derwentensis TaxID=113562 RepID=A0A1H2BS86_9ACTN|nr:GAF and ANTAR domain-containing protein [Actinoplanes derwentensis]GID83013.1 GAF domain-containing protein [Actinoplanes derwentensis]SDT60646.1 ANTAR domain-containing protein [Actinoplanes derwentensis]
MLTTARGPVVAVLGGDATGRAAAIRRLVADGPAASAGAVTFLTHLCRVAARELPATGVGISLMAEKGVRGLCVASDDLGERLEELQFVLGEGPCIDAYATRRPVLCGDLAGQDPNRWPVYTPMVREAGIHAVFAFPLQIGAARLGTMDVLRDRAGPLRAGEIETALLIADISVDVLLAGQEDDSGDGSGLVGDVGNRAQLFQAQGMVMVQLGVPLHEALTRMRAYAYANDRRLADVARDVVDRALRFDSDTP